LESDGYVGLTERSVARVGLCQGLAGSDKGSAKPGVRDSILLRIRQILLMSLLGSPPIQAQVVAASCLQPLMPEDLFDVPDRASVEE
jgi:hypothetical protein